MAATPASDAGSHSRQDRQERERDVLRELRELSGPRERTQGRAEPPSPQAGTIDEKERTEQ